MIIALQTYQNPDDGQGDLAAALELARLLADLEPRPRDDVLLAIVLQPGTPRTPLLERTLAHCGLKLPVELVTSPFEGRGHPVGCTALWRGTTHHYHQMHLAKTIGLHTSYDNHTEHGSALLTLDGGDGVPLHRDWVDIVTDLHRETLGQGKLITGTPYFLGTCPLHVNPNAVFELEIFTKHPQLLEDVPPYDGTVMTNFDVHHREVMLEEASLSSVVRTDWNGDGRAASAQILVEVAGESAWLHGYHDANLRWLAREHLALDPPRPAIQRYDVANLRQHELVRRSFEREGG